MAKLVLPNRTKPSHTTSGKTQLTAKQALAQTARAPQDPHGWKEHGRHLFNVDDLTGAKAALKRAVELDPADHGIWLLLGYTLLNAGEESASLEHFEHALTIQGDLFEAHLNLAYLYLRRNDTSKSITHIEKALALQPDSNLALRVKAQLLTVSSKHEEAISIFERLIRQDQNNVHGYWNDLGNIKRELSRFEEALECYRKAATHSATSSIALSNQITLLHYLPGRDPAEILDLCKKWGQTFTPRKTVQRPLPDDRSPDRRLKIGMISDGFRQHPVGAMITPAMAHLKRFGIELFLYSSSSAVDSVTEKLMAVADRWTPIFNVSDDDLADRIRNDHIDILIDLSGHNAGTRMKTIAQEPAPLIVKWVGGLINTTGVPAIDYLITDGVESPSGSDAFYTEKLIRMPDDYICYMPPEHIPNVGPLPALRNGHITFGCFNNPTKINDVLLGHWARLLQAVPGSQLFLKGGPFGTNDLRERTLSTLASHGISADRIRLEGQSQHFELLDCYNEVDIALDPWPYSGGLTTCEAMLMGVPVITLPGPTFAGRHSATHLVNAGMPELVVTDWDEYQTRAVELASDLQSLATIRSHLRQILLESPVCNGQKYGHHLADALRAIWQRYCEGKAIAALAFTAEGQPWFEGDEQPLALVHPTPEHCPGSQAFRFALQSRIITLDHGSSLVTRDDFLGLSQLGAFAVVAIDPASVVRDPGVLTQPGHIQQYTPHIALGNGETATLYACLETSFSGTQEPLPADLLPSFASQGARVLTRMPIPTVRLDDIDGLDRIDWLILDDRHDNLKILQAGHNALTSVLALQVRVSFTSLFKEQCDFAGLTELLAKHHLRLMRLDNAKHASLFSIGTPIKNTFSGSQLISADAIFVPDETRMKRLDKESRLKLAFILHTVYRAPDAAHRALAMSEDDSANAYLVASGLAAPDTAPLVRAPAMLRSKNAKMRTYVGIPIYNEEQHIEQTVQSLINQTADGVGFLVADNFSTDRTLEIVRDLVGNDSRFEIFQHERNCGSAVNLQFVFENTASEYFMWLGGHDYLSPRYFEEVMNKLDGDSGLSLVLGMPYAVQESTIRFLQSGIYDFSDPSPENRYLDSVARLANCTIVQSVFRRQHLQDIDIRGVPSFDHVLLSHLLWKGRLGYAENAKYYRRYFPARPESANARISGNGAALSRADFYQYYLDDFTKLARDTVDSARLHTMTNSIQSILLQRFGQPEHNALVSA